MGGLGDGGGVGSATAGPSMCLLFLQGCLQGTNVTAIYLSQVLGYVGFIIIVAIAPCEHLH